MKSSRTPKLLPFLLFVAGSYPGPVAAQGPPIEQILGRYESTVDGGARSFDYEFDLVGFPDGSVRLQWKRNRETERPFFTYDREGSRLLYQGKYDRHVLYVDAAEGTISGSVPGLIGDDHLLHLDRGGDTRKIRERYREALAEWNESARLSLDDADGDRQWCYVYARWLHQYREEHPRARPPSRVTDASLILLADDRFVPVFGKSYLDMSGGDRHKIDKRDYECERDHIPPRYHAGLPNMGLAFYGGGDERIVAAVRELNQRRARFAAELDRLRTLPATEEGFWVAAASDLDRLPGLENDDGGASLSAVDRATHGRVRRAAMARAAGPILVAYVDSLLASASGLEGRLTLRDPPPLRRRHGAVDPDGGAVDARREAGRRARDRRARGAARAPARGAGSADRRGAGRRGVSSGAPPVSVRFDQLMALAPADVAERERARLEARADAMEAETLKALAARLDALDETDSPMRAGADWARDFMAAELQDMEAYTPVFRRLMARRAADMDADYESLADEFADEGDPDRLREKLRHYFGVRGDSELPKVRQLYRLAQERADLLDWVDDWYCASRASNEMVPTLLAPEGVPHLALCAAADDLIQRYMAVVRNEPGAAGEFGRFCGALAQGPGGSSIAAGLCEMAQAGGIIGRIFSGVEARITGLDVQRCRYDRTLVIERLERLVRDGRVVSENNNTVSYPEGGYVCRQRVRFSFAKAGESDAFTRFLEIFQRASNEWSGGFYTNTSDGLWFIGGGTAEIGGDPAPATPLPEADFAALNDGLEGTATSPGLAELLVQAAIGRLVKAGRGTAAATLLTRHCGRMSVTIRQCLRQPGGGAITYRLRWLEASEAPVTEVERALPGELLSRYRRIRSTDMAGEALFTGLLRMLGTAGGPPKLDGLFLSG